MPKIETNVVIFLSALIVCVFAVEQPSEYKDVIDQFKELLRKQKEEFEEKLRQQAELITKQDEIITNQRKDFEEKFRRQDDLIWKLTVEVNKNKISNMQSKEQHQVEREEKQTRQSFSQTDSRDEQKKKRSDDIGPLEVVVNEVSQQLSDVTADIQALKNKDQSLSDDIAMARASTYVHWGSSTCGNSSQLVYSGVVGGSYYSHSGGAANALCLPVSPVYSTSSQGSHMDYGYAELYGGEYEVAPEAANNLDAVCAVCRAPRATTVMIPVAITCNPGWTLEYSGYIMANLPNSDRSSTEFICVDSKLEGLTGTNENEDQFVLYYTKTHCGSLPCPPYVNGKVVNCIVCSK